MDQDSKILNFPLHGKIDRQLEDPAPPQEASVDDRNSSTAVLSAPPANEPPPPVWMQRFFLVSTVIFCLWIGMVLSVLPWLPAWTENALVSDFPTLRWLLGTGFVRGLATGLGLLDLWIGISEAVHYRDRR